MPKMFQKIADYTELLIPDDLLSDSSILTATREALTPENCQNVEVIGWLYQFYISEKKDDVFAALKKGQEDHAGEHPCGHAAVHAALDRALPRRELAGPVMDAEPSRLAADRADGLLHQTGRRTTFPGLSVVFRRSGSTTMLADELERVVQARARNVA